MKFKCNITGCVYNFESGLDIKSMLKNPDYTEVPEVAPAKDPVKPATIVVATPAPVAPATPLPVPPAASKAV